MTKDEALKMALDALEVANSCVDGYYIPKGKTHLPEIKLAITAIKEALAQPEQCQCPNCKVTLHASDCAVHSGPAYPAGGCDCGAQQEPVAWRAKNFYENQEGWFYAEWHQNGLTPQVAELLYITPPQRTWVGLTDEEVKDIVWNLPYEPSQEHIRAIEVKLKEKNNV